MFDNNQDTIILPKPQNVDSRWMTVDQEGNYISEGKTPAEAIEIAKAKTSSYTVLFIPKEGSTYIF